MNSDATKSISSKWSARQMAMIGLMAAVICILGPLSIFRTSGCCLCRIYAGHEEGDT